MKEIKRAIMDNRFADRLRGEMIFDEDEYSALAGSLTALASEMKEHEVIDKDLALALYTLPLAVRNMLLAYRDRAKEDDVFAAKLEDAWVELDELVTECLL